ncbi:hypothetical protein [Herbaspirillum sp. B65]|uniref:hypothetical protein n=1 Tax=Herbaspirillum sp. B65 TaxID=137708 RepID=UPI0011D2759D|nr:hypothetical protein [Herbaspirillum sp. B65]
MNNATFPGVRFSFRKAMSVLSGGAGVASALLWHHSSSNQLKAAAISHGLSLNPDALRQSLSAYPELIHQSSIALMEIMNGLNNLALIQNNLAAVFAMAASICVAAALFTEG